MHFTEDVAQPVSNGQTCNNYAHQRSTPLSVSSLEAPKGEESDTVVPWKVNDKWALLKSKLPEIGQVGEDIVPGAVPSERASGVKNGRKQQDNVRSIFMAGIDNKVSTSYFVIQNKISKT